MAVEAHGKGLFAWSEWAAALGEALKSGNGGVGDDSYYQAWLTVLEKVMRDKRILTAKEIHERHEAWDHAARATPHGEPIVLGREKQLPRDASPNRR